MQAYKAYQPMDESSDAVLLEAIQSYEANKPMETSYDDDEPMEDSQTGGNTLFELHLTPTQPRRRWRNVVDKQVYNAILHQTHNATPVTIWVNK